MYRSIHVLFLTILLATECMAQTPLSGTYRLISFTQEIDGSAPIEAMGKLPRGYAILTPTRWMNIFTSENRKFGTSTDERAALWDSLVTYTGNYRLEGSKLIVTVDASWNERWNGTQVVRNWAVEGSRLTITTERAPSARDPSKMSLARAVFEKVE